MVLTFHVIRLFKSGFYGYKVFTCDMIKTGRGYEGMYKKMTVLSVIFG